MIGGEAASLYMPSNISRGSFDLSSHGGQSRLMGAYFIRIILFFYIISK
jgi:hypothetical protein